MIVIFGGGVRYLLHSAKPAASNAPSPFGIPALLGSLLFPPEPQDPNAWEPG